MLPTRTDNTRNATLKKVTSVARRTPMATTAEAQRLPFRVLQTSQDAQPADLTPEDQQKLAHPDSGAAKE